MLCAGLWCYEGVLAMISEICQNSNVIKSILNAFSPAFYIHNVTDQYDPI